HDRSLLDEARGMTASLQTIQVQEKLEDFDYKFDEVNIDRLVMPPPPRPVSMFEVTEWAEKRTELMALYANREIQIGHHGRIRQKAAFSSFYIPDENVTVPVWKLLEGDSPRSDYYRYLLRQERNALEEHARVAGCRLIISPYTQSHYSGPSIGKPRIKSLLNFLRDMPDDKLEVVLSPLARQNNHTIVGDWFAAESHIPSPGGYRHTVFHFHASTVLRHIKRFDEEFVRVRDIVFQKNNCTACILSDSGLST
ncbi:MAG: hypothetical protein OEU26_20840, partial [Candidatus Tectomicrobia bacterium]|nr:hypothetical protein [Candidatus Tectomicrobia bacterium]